MKLAEGMKERLKAEIVERLAVLPEVRRIVVFGSFVNSNEPHDLDVAVFQESDESYYPLAIKYRKLLRPVADIIPLDVIPVRKNPEEGPFLEEMRKGEVLYER